MNLFDKAREIFETFGLIFDDLVTDKNGGARFNKAVVMDDGRVGVAVDAYNPLGYCLVGALTKAKYGACFYDNTMPEMHFLAKYLSEHGLRRIKPPYQENNPCAPIFQYNDGKLREKGTDGAIHLMKEVSEAWDLEHPVEQPLPGMEETH